MMEESTFGKKTIGLVVGIVLVLLAIGYSSVVFWGEGMLNRPSTNTDSLNDVPVYVMSWLATDTSGERYKLLHSNVNVNVEVYNPKNIELNKDNCSIVCVMPIQNVLHAKINFITESKYKAANANTYLLRILSDEEKFEFLDIKKLELASYNLNSNVINALNAYIPLYCLNNEQLLYDVKNMLVLAVPDSVLNKTYKCLVYDCVGSLTDNKYGFFVLGQDEHIANLKPGEETIVPVTFLCDVCKRSFYSGNVVVINTSPRDWDSTTIMCIESDDTRPVYASDMAEPVSIEGASDLWMSAVQNSIFVVKHTEQISESESLEGNALELLLLNIQKAQKNYKDSVMNMFNEIGAKEESQFAFAFDIQRRNCTMRVHYPQED